MFGPQRQAGGVTMITHPMFRAPIIIVNIFNHYNVQLANNMTISNSSLMQCLLVATLFTIFSFILCYSAEKNGLHPKHKLL